MLINCCHSHTVLLTMNIQNKLKLLQQTHTTNTPTHTTNTHNKQTHTTNKHTQQTHTQQTNTHNKHTHNKPTQLTHQHTQQTHTHKHNKHIHPNKTKIETNPMKTNNSITYIYTMLLLYQSTSLIKQIKPQWSPTP